VSVRASASHLYYTRSSLVVSLQNHWDSFNPISNPIHSIHTHIHPPANPLPDDRLSSLPSTQPRRPLIFLLFPSSFVHYLSLSLSSSHLDNNPSRLAGAVLRTAPTTPAVPDTSSYLLWVLDRRQFSALANSRADLVRISITLIFLVTVPGYLLSPEEQGVCPADASH